MNFTDIALGVVRTTFTDKRGKNWEIAIQPNPGARQKETQWIASAYKSGWSLFPKFRIFGETQDEAYGTVALLLSSRAW
jgi:hypothetical protein